MPRKPLKFRQVIGTGVLTLAVALIAWLLLGVWDVVPLVLQLPGESLLRTHAAAAVACLLVAAWSFWDV